MTTEFEKTKNLQYIDVNFVFRILCLVASVEAFRRYEIIGERVFELSETKNKIGKDGDLFEELDPPDTNNQEENTLNKCGRRRTGKEIRIEFRK